jgi:hypothetical protein
MVFIGCSEGRKGPLIHLNVRRGERKLGQYYNPKTNEASRERHCTHGDENKCLFHAGLRIVHKAMNDHL